MISVTSWQSNYEYEVEYEIILASSRLICSSNHQGDFYFHLKASSLFFSRGSVYFFCISDPYFATWKTILFESYSFIIIMTFPYAIKFSDLGVRQCKLLLLYFFIWSTDYIDVQINWFIFGLCVSLQCRRFFYQGLTSGIYACSITSYKPITLPITSIFVCNSHISLYALAKITVSLLLISYGLRHVRYDF